MQIDMIATAFPSDDVRRGWTCSKCDHSLSPDVDECAACNAYTPTPQPYTVSWPYTNPQVINIPSVWVQPNTGTPPNTWTTGSTFNA